MRSEIPVWLALAVPAMCAVLVLGLNLKVKRECEARGGVAWVTQAPQYTDMIRSGKAVTIITCYEKAGR